ncbi:DeoR/GlpR family DNA-binding transcription regulator [Cochlodiniinecator piscidefendens]|uniref:DeoR/GlpR family DNA-binding transcription regulator n=1 Tax=Cochlodiniinecator piscidefendens TaxID=2715756 RepID=UPI00140A932F|nr:DeoR/GlpR family DNA-binding transcription regulator [Cochlodiniinecator piscidefendens]
MARKKIDRQSRLLEIIANTGYGRIEDLAGSLYVSEQTIRRDIFELDQAKKLRRTHGGAVFLGGVESQDYIQRRFSATDVKHRIAEKVVSLISDGDSIFLDAGTTCEVIAKALHARRDLKIVTYSLAAAMHLKDRNDFTIALPGGFLRHIDGSLFGGPVEGFMEKFRFDCSIISVSGISPSGELADDDHWEVANVKLAIQRSQNVILASDSSKFAKPGHVALCTFDDVSMFVTDGLPQTSLGAQIQDQVDVHLV